jgi:hypothetical protein
MNDQANEPKTAPLSAAEFAERVLANPHDTSAELLAALQGNPEREAERARALELDAKIRRELGSVSAPPELRQKLLNPEALAGARARGFPGFAANASWFSRVLPVAACLVAALGIATYTTARQHAALEKEIFAHVYWEEAFFGNTALIPVPDVNAKMEAVVGAHLEMSDAVENMKVTYADDCWVARQISFHMIMRGQTGAVSVMMIPSSEHDSEFRIGDERFDGVVTPTNGGYLVVIGNKQEPITEYRNLLSANLDWEY